MSHNPTEFNEYIELASAEIVKQSRSIHQCIHLIGKESENNEYVEQYYKGFELIDWCRRKASTRLDDATDYVEGNPEGGIECFWSHCAQVAEHIVNDALTDRVDAILGLRQKEVTA